MLIIAIIFIGFITWAIYEDEGILHAIGAFFTLILISALVFILSLMIEGTFRDVPIRTDKVIEHKIVSLKDNTSVSGNFFLGCGNVDGNTKYYTYVVTGTNRYILKSFNSDQIYIQEDSIDVENAYIERITKYYKCTIVPFPFSINVGGLSAYIIHVPIGTIVKNMTLDSE